MNREQREIHEKATKVSRILAQDYLIALEAKKNASNVSDAERELQIQQLNRNTTNTINSLTYLKVKDTVSLTEFVSDWKYKAGNSRVDRILFNHGKIINCLRKSTYITFEGSVLESVIIKRPKLEYPFHPSKRYTPFATTPMVEDKQQIRVTDEDIEHQCVVRVQVMESVPPLPKDLCKVILQYSDVIILQRMLLFKCFLSQKNNLLNIPLWFICDASNLKQDYAMILKHRKKCF
jgi:hypothetical protein